MRQQREPEDTRPVVRWTEPIAEVQSGTVYSPATWRVSRSWEAKVNPDQTLADPTHQVHVVREYRDGNSTVLPIPPDTKTLVALVEAILTAAAAERPGEGTGA